MTPSALLDRLNEALQAKLAEARALRLTGRHRALERERCGACQFTECPEHQGPQSRDDNRRLRVITPSLD